MNKCDNPPHEDVIMCISDGAISFDRLGIYKKGSNKYIHLFKGNLVGCGDSDFNSVYGPKNIITNIEGTQYETRFDINPPTNAIHTEHYLNDNIDAIYNGIRTSNKIISSNNYKVNIVAFCKYYKHNNEGEIDFGGLYHTTQFITLPAYSGALDHPYLKGLIGELGNKQCEQASNMEGSNWVYLGTEKIEITFIKTSGRTVFAINDWIPYPKHKRGVNCVINPNYSYKPAHTPNDEIAACVIWTMRVHMMVTSQNNIRKDPDINFLTKTIYHN